MTIRNAPGLATALLAGALMVPGCTKEQAPAPAAKTGEVRKTTGADPQDLLNKLAKKVGEKVAGATGALTKGGRPVSAEEYEKLLLGVAKCKLGPNDLEWDCPEYKAYREARNRNTALRDLAGRTAGLGLKQLHHQSPGVRLLAARLLGSFFGARAEVQEAVIKAAPEEKHPLVLAALIGAVGSSMKANPKVAELVLKMANHEEEQVRLETLRWLPSSWGRAVAGSADKVIEMLTKDPSPKVRQTACERAGETGDQRLLAIYKKLTSKPEEQPDLYAACMRGLVEMWDPFMSTEVAPSPEAFKLTLARLHDKPRSKVRPTWRIMQSLTRQPRGDPPWFKREALVKALAAVALDENANWMARTGSCQALGGLKATAELGAISKALAAKTDFENRNVVKAADESLARVK